MNRNWLLIVLVFSLALNVGAVGAFAYLRYQDRPIVGLAAPSEQGPVTLPELWSSINLDLEQQRTMRGLMPKHRQRIMGLRMEMQQKRQELFKLMEAGESSWSAMQAKIQEISGLQGKLEEEVAHFLLESQKILKPEQRAAFLQVMGKCLAVRGGGMGQPCGPGFRRGKGKGMGLGKFGPLAPPQGSP